MSLADRAKQRKGSTGGGLAARAQQRKQAKPKRGFLSGVADALTLGATKPKPQPKPAPAQQRLDRLAKLGMAPAGSFDEFTFKRQYATLKPEERQYVDSKLKRTIQPDELPTREQLAGLILSAPIGVGAVAKVGTQLAAKGGNTAKAGRALIKTAQTVEKAGQAKGAAGFAARRIPEATRAAAENVAFEGAATIPESPAEFVRRAPMAAALGAGLGGVFGGVTEGLGGVRRVAQKADLQTMAETPRGKALVEALQKEVPETTVRDSRTVQPEVQRPPVGKARQPGVPENVAGQYAPTPTTTPEAPRMAEKPPPGAEAGVGAAKAAPKVRGVGDMAAIALEPVDSITAKLTFGKEVLSGVEENIHKTVTARGKEYNFSQYTYDLPDGRKRIVLTADDPAQLIDAAAVIKPVDGGVVIEMIHGGKTGFKRLGGILARRIKRQYGAIVPDIDAPLSEAGRKATEKLVAKSPDVPNVERPAVRMADDAPPPLETPAKTATKGPEPVTGIRKSIVEAERKSSGLPEVELKPYQAKEASHVQGKAAIDSGQVDGTALTAEMLDNPRPPTATELGALAYRKSQIMKALDTATGEERTRLQDLLDTNQRASRNAGRLWSESGQAMQIATDMEGSLAEVYQAARKNKGRALSEAESDKIAKLHQKLKATEAAYDVERQAAQARIAEMQARIDAGQGAPARRPRIIKEASEFASNQWGAENKIFTREVVEAARTRLRAKAATPRTGIDPDMVKDLAIEIGFQVESGVRFSYKTLHKYLRTEYGAKSDEISAAYKQTMNENRLDAAKKRTVHRLREVKEAVKAGEDIPRAPEIVPDAKLRRLRTQLDAAKKKLDEIQNTPERQSQMQAKRQAAIEVRLEKQIADIEQRIATKAPVPKKVSDRIPTKREVQLRAEVEAARLRLMNEITPTFSVRNVRQNATTLMNGTLGWVVGFDNSVLMRQGWNMIFHNTRAWGKAVVASHKALWSEGLALIYDDAIANHPKFGLARKSGLDYTSLRADAPMHRAEEASMAMRSAGKIPLVGKILRPFDRAFTVGANVLRHAAFYAKAMAKGDNWSPADAKAYAEMLNAITGRGNLGRLGTYQAEMNMIFVSARQFIGDLQTLALPLTGKSKEVRMESLTMIAKQVVALGALVAAVNASGKARIGTNPMGPDFMQLRPKDEDGSLSNTRFDLIPGGKRSAVRMLFNVGRAVYDYSRFAEDKPGPYTRTPTDVIKRYLSNKINPGARYISWGVTGKDWMGEPQTFGQATGELVTPWNAVEVWEAFKLSGVTEGAAAIPATFYGIGANTYEERPTNSGPKLPTVR